MLGDDASTHLAEVYLDAHKRSNNHGRCWQLGSSQLHCGSPSRVALPLRGAEYMSACVGVYMQLQQPRWLDAETALPLLAALTVDCTLQWQNQGEHAAGSNCPATTPSI